MKRGRLPLTALRSFEAAGRRLSFTHAADELFISQAAVSRQVRELETLLGQALFERKHRSVHLTPAGETLLAVLTSSFDDIGDCLDALHGRKAAVLTVSVEPSFAACWLVPHLSEFQQRFPDIDVNMDADPRLVEFRTNEASVAIRHSLTAKDWPRVESRRLFETRISPVISPDLLEGNPPLNAPKDLTFYPLLHEERHDAWRRWFEAANLPADGIQRGFVFGDSGQTLQAALRGQGAALMDELFAVEEIAAGRLLRPFDVSIPYGSYWIVARRFDMLPETALSFIHWLESHFTVEI